MGFPTAREAHRAGQKMVNDAREAGIAGVEGKSRKRKKGSKPSGLGGSLKMQ